MDQKPILYLALPALEVRQEGKCMAALTKASQKIVGLKAASLQ